MTLIENNKIQNVLQEIRLLKEEYQKRESALREELMENVLGFSTYIELYIYVKHSSANNLEFHKRMFLAREAWLSHQKTKKETYY